MNRLSYSDLFYLLCCPPCPSTVAAKLSFFPPQSTYSFSSTDSDWKFKVNFTERTQWKHPQRDREKLEGFYAVTDGGNTLACIFVRCTSIPKYTILFSHGSAVDVGQMSSFYLDVGTRIGCNIIGYDYCGYGASSGKPSLKYLFTDIRAVWEAIEIYYKLEPERMILYGQGIGTVPTIALASRHKVGAVLLHSPALSSMRKEYPNARRLWCCDPLSRTNKVPRVISPIVIIHGTDEDVVDCSNGFALCKICSHRIEPLWMVISNEDDEEITVEELQTRGAVVSRYNLAKIKLSLRMLW